jgi:hypothetical protein
MAHPNFFKSSVRQEASALALFPMPLPEEENLGKQRIRYSARGIPMLQTLKLEERSNSILL